MKSPYNNLLNINYPGSGWLNSENTKSILTKMISKEMNGNQVNKSLLARPQLHTDPIQRLADPIFSLLVEHYTYDAAAEMRQIPPIDECKPTENEVLSLIENGWIRPAIDLTSRILNKMGFSYAKSYSIEHTSSQFTAESGRLWCLRFALLARMKFISVLESELSGFQNLDCPNLYREFYSDTCPVYVKGSLIPFSMRLIHAELPLFFNKFSEALNRLYYLLAVIKRIIVNIDSGYSEDGTNLCSDEVVKNCSLKIWQKRRSRVLVSCMRVLIASKDYPSVMNIVHNLIEKSKTDLVMSYSEDALYHLLGRVYLQLGDVDNAECYFEQSLRILKEYLEKESHQESVKAIDDAIQTKTLLQTALINISRNNFEEAKKSFHQCLEINPNCTLVLNNYGVCCLYLKQVQEAICIFEKLLQNGIRHDGLIFNLCILYELQTNQIKNRKLKIVKILSKFPGDDFNIASFKLTNSE